MEENIDKDLETQQKEAKNTAEDILRDFSFKTLQENISNENYKKFVVQIDLDNATYFESFSPSQRNELINSFLKKQQKQIVSSIRNKRLSDYTKHLIIIIFTVILVLPLVYTIINKSIILTINNYRQTQNNFEKLYNKGSLKKKDLSKMKRLSND